MARPGLIKHPKFLRLLHTLQLPLPHALGYLECLWSSCYERGDDRVGDATDVELAAHWPGEPGKLAETLAACRFIDDRGDGTYAVHDLYDHAPEYVQRRMEREARRKQKGKSLTDLRREAGRARHGLPPASVSKCLSPADGGSANGATPAPAPTPTPIRGMNSPETPSCPEAAEPPSGQEEGVPEVLLTFPVVGGSLKEWPLTRKQVSEFESAFPALDVAGECRKALVWVRSDERRRKTARGMQRFLFGWLQRAQDYGGARANGRPPPPDQGAFMAAFRKARGDKE